MEPHTPLFLPPAKANSVLTCLDWETKRRSVAGLLLSSARHGLSPEPGPNLIIGYLSSAENGKRTTLLASHFFSLSIQHVSQIQSAFVRESLRERACHYSLLWLTSITKWLGKTFWWDRPRWDHNSKSEREKVVMERVVLICVLQSWLFLPELCGTQTGLDDWIWPLSTGPSRLSGIS